MALKGQQIDWDVVREVLYAIRDNTGALEPLNEADFREVVKAHHHDNEDFEHSYSYALDDRLIMKSDDKVYVLGLTKTGLDLLLVLMNEDVMEKMFDLATENGVSLTADVIIEAGRRLSLKKMGLE